MHVHRGWIAVTALVLVAGATQAQTVPIGQEFPTFRAAGAIDKKPVDLGALRGQVVLVDFWATWCGPCRAAVPTIRDFHKQYADQGFTIVSVSADRTLSDLTAYAEREKMDWYHVWDQDGKLAQKYGVPGYPTLYLLDRRGQVAFYELGFTPGGAPLRAAIEKALKQPREIAPEVLEAGRAKLTQADTLRKEKKMVEALALYREVAQDCAGSEVGQEAFKKAGDVERAAAKQAEAEKLAASEAPRWLKYARDQAEAGRLDQARKYFKKLVEKYPDREEGRAAAAELKQLPPE
jgi:thiol-disulfide isomerase/thioredoxin